MYREVRVSLAVPLLRIGKARVPDESPLEPLFLAEGQRTERLGQQRHRFHPHGDLAGPRAKHRPGHPDHVAQVEQVDEREYLFAEIITAEVHLDPRPLVCQMAEHRLPVRAPCDQPARNSDDLTLLYAFRQ